VASPADATILSWQQSLIPRPDSRSISVGSRERTTNNAARLQPGRNSHLTDCRESSVETTDSFLSRTFPVDSGAEVRVVVEYIHAEAFVL
jgi:hypothetical protein